MVLDKETGDLAISLGGDRTVICSRDCNGFYPMSFVGLRGAVQNKDIHCLPGNVLLLGDVFFKIFSADIFNTEQILLKPLNWVSVVYCPIYSVLLWCKKVFRNMRHSFCCKDCLHK